MYMYFSFCRWCDHCIATATGDKETRALPFSTSGSRNLQLPRRSVSHSFTTSSPLPPSLTRSLSLDCPCCPSPSLPPSVIPLPPFPFLLHLISPLRTPSPSTLPHLHTPSPSTPLTLQTPSPSVPSSMFRHIPFSPHPPVWITAVLGNSSSHIFRYMYMYRDLCYALMHMYMYMYMYMYVYMYMHAAFCQYGFPPSPSLPASVAR